MNFINKVIKNKNRILLAADVLLIPGAFFFQWLSGQMLARPSDCPWNYFGGKCVTCGGTHFVNTLLKGQLAEAFHHNQFLFICTVVLALSYILLHLWWLGGSSLAKKALRIVYSIPGLILFCVSMIAFLLIRNLPVFVMLMNILV